MAKPDDRSDNVEKLQSMVQNTLQNIDEAEGYLSKHGDEIPAKERKDIESKIERRRESVEGFRSEIKDEANS